MQQNQQRTPQQDLQYAKGHYQMGDYFEASKHSGVLKAHFPDQPPILAINGIVFSRLGLDVHAIADLQRAADMTEESLATRDEQDSARPQVIDQLVLVCVAMCNSLVRLGMHDEAVSVIDRALGWDAERPDAIAAKAQAVAIAGDPAAGRRLIDEALAKELDAIRLAIAAGRIALAEGGEVDENVIALLREQTQRVGLAACDLADALRVLGDLEDRAAAYDNAFSAYRRAANLRKGQFNAQGHSKMASKIISEWSAGAMSKLVKPETDGSPVVLMIGPPCCGVNELSALLGQADTVSTIGPIESLGMIAQKHFGAKAGVLRPAVLSPNGIRGKQIADGAKAYETQVDPLIKPGSNVWIDTNPLNIWVTGMAALMFPGLKVVMCRRDPRACALDCYTADLPGLFPYAGDLVDAASYIADCNRMMDHWAEVLGDERIECEVIEVQYADLENDLVAAARDLGTKLGAEGLDSMSQINLPIRKSPDPKNYQMKLGVVDELFAQLGADA